MNNWGVDDEQITVTEFVSIAAATHRRLMYVTGKMLHINNKKKHPSENFDGIN